MSAAFDVNWGGVDLCDEFGLFIEYGSISCDPPSPKLSVVSVPGGTDIDLTDALTGHAAYEMRKVGFTLYCDGRRGRAWQDVSRDVVSLMHGAESDFTLSWDPGYTYHGRASVKSVTFLPRSSCRIAVEITANPWKLREVHTETVDAVGGAALTCVSGLRPVHPLVKSDYPVVVEWEGASITVPAGETYRVTGITFGPGENELWLSVSRYRTASWADVASRTWNDVSHIRWAGIVVEDGEAGPADFPGSGLVTVSWEEAYL